MNERKQRTYIHYITWFPEVDVERIDREGFFISGHFPVNPHGQQNVPQHEEHEN